MQQRWSEARGLFVSVLTPPLVWLALFFVAPLTIIWTYSFGRNAGLTGIAVDGTFANYAHALNPLYLSILLKSLWFAVLTTAVCLIVGFPVAVAITFAPQRAKAWLLLLIMLPFWTNLLIRTYALMAIMRAQGYANLALGWLWAGFRAASRLANHPLGAFSPLPLLYNNGAVIMGLVYVQLPFMVLPLYSALDRLDRSLLEASLDLGAGHLTTFRRIVIPLAMPGILSGVVITLIPSIGAYLTPDLLGGPNSLMISNVIERQFKAANNWPFGAALSFLLMYLTFAAIGFQALAARRRTLRETRR